MHDEPRTRKEQHDLYVRLMGFYEYLLHRLPVGTVTMECRTDNAAGRIWEYHWRARRGVETVAATYQICEIDMIQRKIRAAEWAESVAARWMLDYGRMASDWIHRYAGEDDE